jgi:hypothetical protein
MATKSVPLALPSTAYGEGSGWRRGEHLIDALPYIDGLGPEIKQQVCFFLQLWEVLLEPNATKRLLNRWMP